MAKKFSELPSASALTGTEIVAVVQDGVSKRTTSQDIADLTQTFFRGKYISLAALEAAIPTGEDGDYAIVDAGSGTDASQYIWDADEGWVQSSGVGTVVSVTGQSVNNTDPSNPVVNAWPLSGTEPTGFGGNVVIPGNEFNVTLGQSGDRMGDYRVWASGTARIDGAGAAGIQSAGDVDMTSNAGILKLGATGHILTDNNVTKKGLQTAATGYVTDPRSYADKEYVDATVSSAVTGLWDDRGNYDASGNVFPSSGGSGTAGAILKGDVWTISVAGTLGGTSVSPGDTVRALVDTPGSTSSNWAINAASSGSTTPNASTTVAGKVEMATSAETIARTATGGTGAALAVGPVELADKLRANRTVTGTDSIVQADSEKLIYFNSASAFNFTIDQLAVDSYAIIRNIGSANVTFVNGTGVTISGQTVLRPGESGSIVYRTATAPIIETNTTKTRTNETTNFSLTSDDDETIIIANPSSNITCTVPTLSADAWVQIYNKGTANVLFTAGSGATLLNSLVLVPNSGCIVYWDTSTNIILISGTSVTWSSIDSKPTTIEGFGIVDGVRKVDFNFSQQGNGAGVETNLYSFSIAGGTLSSDGDSLDIVAAGTFANTANNKRIRLKFGATTIFDSGALAITAAADWKIECKIIRSSATSQKTITELKTSSSVLVSTVDYNTSAETLASASSLVLTGEASGASDVVKELIKVLKEGH